MYSPPAGNRSATATFSGEAGQDFPLDTFTSGRKVAPPSSEAAKRISVQRKLPLIVLPSPRPSYQATPTTPSLLTAIAGVRE
jgi:hypothetical protein